MTRYAIIVDGVVVNHAEAESDFAHLQGWIPADGSRIGDFWDGDKFTHPPAPPEPSQFDRDKSRYEKRAGVKDQLLAYMAADNMARVRSGEWTVQNLIDLLGDPAVAAANQFMATLSFELAAQSIAQATLPLLTPEIKALWIGKLQEHFYL